MWFAIYRINGKKLCKTTGIQVNNKVAGPRLLKKLAQEVAETIERAAKGEMLTHDAMEAVRKAGDSYGFSQIPTTREWLEKDFADRKQFMPIVRRFLKSIGDDAERPIDCLKPSLIERFYQQEMKNIALSSLRNYKGILSASFNRALFDDLIKINPFARTKLPRNTRERKKQAFTMEQIHTMIETFPHPWPDMIKVSFLTGGQRLGDIATLKWEQIDDKEGTINFITQKTNRILRIKMNEVLQEMLTRLKNNSIYVFPYAAERYKKKGYLSNDFSSLVYKAGFVEKPKEKLPGNMLHVNPLTFHSIRHTVVSLLRSSNLFSADIARSIVGHSSEAIERAYFHANSEMVDNGYLYLGDHLKEKRAPTC